MNQSRLDPHVQYDPATQRLIGWQAAQLDEQLEDLKTAARDLDTDWLEWQSAPGRNTIGMLLAHIAVAETFWMKVVCAGLHGRPESDDVIHGVLGIRSADDGMPAPSDGDHPPTLARWPLERYEACLDAARAATHDMLLGWTDEDLDAEFEVEDWTCTRGWVLYHLLEHLSQHLGQVRQLRRDAHVAGNTDD